MEIGEIKQRLGIRQVLEHYGLQPDKHNRLQCPFHADKTPSLQIYPKRIHIVASAVTVVPAPAM